MSSEEKEISRVKRSKGEAKDSYDRMSKWYDLMAKPEKKYVMRGVEKLDITEGETVLEIGFGTGDALLSLAKGVGDSGLLYGIDISEGMLEVAQAKLDKAGLSNRTNLILGDASKLPFEDNFFNALFMSFTLELFDTPEIPVLLHECKRVLKTGGRLGVVAISDTGNDNFMMKMYKWAHVKFPSYVDCRPIFTQVELRKSGFNIKSTETHTMWDLPVDIVIAVK
ncbi:class I SAM-dependent methyltransferase [Methanobacterium ferruginis]|uniref:class I SAM-dependent methyltransferase n=1 Tax=Methanobacterium ferruginis TaxID=710191 RepID=UPI0025745C26|nr:methyltransferase domain-containing protein [Methanobacterium ferruginis]BDZ67104.1 2-heptaprenyl-1,4-naphthoquinone methyltransferase [Methanobacterium ferruginis]